MLTQFKRENTLQNYLKVSRDSARPRIDLADESQKHWSWFKILSWTVVDTVVIGLLYVVCRLFLVVLLYEVTITHTCVVGSALNLDLMYISTKYLIIGAVRWQAHHIVH